MFKKFEKINIADTDTIVIRDYSNYSSSKCRNGGNYGFDTVLHRSDDDTWEAEYQTTSEFAYSCKHGFFTEDASDIDADEAEIFSTEEVYKILQNVKCFAEGTNPFLKEAFCDILFIREGIEYSVLNDKIAF